MAAIFPLFAILCWKFALVSFLFSYREKWLGMVGVWSSTGGSELCDGRAALCLPFPWSKEKASHHSCGEGFFLAEENGTAGWVGRSRGKCSLSVRPWNIESG